MLALTGTDARRWEPKRLRLRLFSVAGTIARKSRRVWLHLSGHAPHRHLFTTGLQLRRRCDLTVNTGSDQEPGQPETCRTGLIRHRHRARQRPHPRQHTTMRRRQPPLEQLPGLTV